MIGRIPIRFVEPREPEGRWPAKAYVGEVIPFAATVFREGHGLLGAELELRAPDGRVTTARMRERHPGTDRWEALARVDAPGDWTFLVRAWSDDWASWRHAAAIKLAAGQDVELTLAEGAQLLRRRARRARHRRTADALLDATLRPEDRFALVDEPRLVADIEAEPIASLVTESEVHALRVERERAGVGAWYEFFPRSEGAVRRKDGTWRSGTFRSAAKSLPRVAEGGFDVLYLPPIHPIGVAHRKGRNNSVTAQPGDPGSPWAIGGPLADGTPGGHRDVHPDLGTLADFRAFVRRARELGIEVALDLALQASPDHPWLREHPEWFAHRPDGSIAYAENPPKQYQDIHPIDFDQDPDGLLAEVLGIVRHWMAQGVRIFRVDNPHTKPLDFWERLLSAVREIDPDVVFLAEAFTRPAMLQSLAAAGFQQSYTYFTWRDTKHELADYLTELARGTSATLRPNLWVSTPDILTEYLQRGGRAGHKIRAVLAATGSPTWGVYAGYELMESVPRPGAEEHLDSEKYEYKARDFAGALASGDSIAPYIARLNEIRRDHPALRQLRNLVVHWSEDDGILVTSKHLPAEFAGGVADGIVVVTNVDPHHARETRFHLDLTELGLDADATFDVVDLITGARWTWGRDVVIRLDPLVEPAHILAIDYRSVR